MLVKKYDDNESVLRIDITDIRGSIDMFIQNNETRNIFYGEISQNLIIKSIETYNQHCHKRNMQDYLDCIYDLTEVINMSEPALKIFQMHLRQEMAGKVRKTGFIIKQYSFGRIVALRTILGARLTNVELFYNEVECQNWLSV